MERLGIDGLALTGINSEAIEFFNENWRSHPARIVDWEWSHADYQPAKGFSLAVWYSGALCGLASGRLGSSKTVRLDYIEGYPSDHPLKGKIIPITLTCAEAYRILIGSDELRIHDVAEHLIGVYERYGFELAPEGGKAHVMKRRRI